MGAVLQVATRFSATRSLAVPIRKYQLSLIAPTPPSTASVDFIFFFPDWTQHIPLCTSFNDMIPLDPIIANDQGNRTTPPPLRHHPHLPPPSRVQRPYFNAVENRHRIWSMHFRSSVGVIWPMVAKATSICPHQTFIIDNQKESILGRKQLADCTKEFKKIPDDEKLNSFKGLLKGPHTLFLTVLVSFSNSSAAYQTEIDSLTKQSKVSENVFLNVYKVLAEAPDPYPLLEAAVDQAIKAIEAHALEAEAAQLRAENAELQQSSSALDVSEHRVEQLKENSLSMTTFSTTLQHSTPSLSKVQGGQGGQRRHLPSHSRPHQLDRVIVATSSSLLHFPSILTMLPLKHFPLHKTQFVRDAHSFTVHLSM
ncbi:hypothetical protein EDD22DRAFT_1015197 [Suillus occidentalis]|nr:hypothetical protein EDD22DRAFT_1015197 [Suillus occidentalis]